MRKTLCIIAAVLTGALAVSAQEADGLNFSARTNRIQVGVGIPGSFTGHIVVPPLYVSYEHGVAEFGRNVVGIGGNFEYAKVNDTYDSRTTKLFNLFAHYHYNVLPRLDVGSRVGLGYGSNTYTDTLDRNYKSKTNMVSFLVGADALYNFSKNFGVFLAVEFDTIPGSSVFRAGLSVQF